ncbi:MAG: hypothetical protein KUA37_01955 [Desulfomicrobium sp.]|nr:hypothetical protein [Pseudomonadota bacterium]MBV1710755.1 hypothetical protein [Desulfomicrobium sp.]MBU4570363.1 hypothetical protein [Pseudomonadota bacterium]MBU4593284.1 hypothetical protein [Pseudomonadota bacterium]MBV1719837.1 hypothetical protein [Desulfomicrobium sp.]
MKIFLIILCVLFTAGCFQDVPKCSDDKTIKQLLEIVRQNDESLLRYDISDVKKSISFEYIRPTGYNKDIKTYTCEARAIISGEFSPYIDEKFEFYVQYESVLDDKDRHVVFMRNTNDNVIQKIGKFANFVLDEEYYFFPRKELFRQTLNEEEVLSYMVDPCFNSSNVIHAKFGDVIEHNGFYIVVGGNTLDIPSEKGAIVAFKSGEEVDTVLIETIQKVNPYYKDMRSKYVLISGNETEYMISDEFGTGDAHIVLNDVYDTFSVALSGSDGFHNYIETSSIMYGKFNTYRAPRK